LVSLLSVPTTLSAVWFNPKNTIFTLSLMLWSILPQPSIQTPSFYIPYDGCYEQSLTQILLHIQISITQISKKTGSKAVHSICTVHDFKWDWTLMRQIQHSDTGSWTILSAACDQK
jgi:hypothetical protein